MTTDPRQRQRDEQIARRLHTDEFLRHHPEYLLDGLPGPIAQALAPLFSQPQPQPQPKETDE